MFILKNDIKIFDGIPSDQGKEKIPSTFELPETPLDYTKLLFFKN